RRTEIEGRSDARGDGHVQDSKDRRAHRPGRSEDDGRRSAERGVADCASANAVDDAVEGADARRLRGEERLLAAVVDQDVPVVPAVVRSLDDVAAQDGPCEDDGLRPAEPGGNEGDAGAVVDGDIERGE